MVGAFKTWFLSTLSGPRGTLVTGTILAKSWVSEGEGGEDRQATLHSVFDIQW